MPSAPKLAPKTIEPCLVGRYTERCIEQHLSTSARASSSISCPVHSTNTCTSSSAAHSAAQDHHRHQRQRQNQRRVRGQPAQPANPIHRNNLPTSFYIPIPQSSLPSSADLSSDPRLLRLGGKEKKSVVIFGKRSFQHIYFGIVA